MISSLFCQSISSSISGFCVTGDGRLDIFNKAILDFFSFGQIQLQIGHGGLDIFMSEFISDIGDRVAVCEHVDGTGMAEAVNRVDIY